jgi:hypothetical protein
MLIADVALAGVVCDTSDRALSDLRLPVLANSPHCFVPAD